MNANNVPVLNIEVNIVLGFNGGCSFGLYIKLLRNRILARS